MIMTRDLAMEGHLAATGFWYRIGGLLGGALVVAGWLFGHGENGFWSTAGALALCIAAYALGSGLARRRNGARVVAGVLAVAGFVGICVSSCGSVVHGEGRSLIGIGLSLLWSAAYLWLYWSKRSREVCSPSYARLVAASTGKPRMTSSLFFWVPLIGFAVAAIMVILMLGFAGMAALAS